jgi:hypothetical protein
MRRNAGTSIARKAALLLAVFAAIFAAGTAARPAFAAPAKVDVDLTRLPSALVFGEVFNMIVEPEMYEGKTVRMRGQFVVYEDDDNPVKRRTFACVILDATACCAQGMEFTLRGSPRWPSDYPEQGKIITVVGRYSQHDVNGYTCTELVDCVLE